MTESKYLVNKNITKLIYKNKDFLISKLELVTIKIIDKSILYFLENPTKDEIYFIVDINKINFSIYIFRIFYIKYIINKFMYKFYTLPELETSIERIQKEINTKLNIQFAVYGESIYDIFHPNKKYIFIVRVKK